MSFDDELVAVRAAELASRPGVSFETSRFLTPHEQAVFFRVAAGISADKLNRLFFYGGCRGAERRAAVFFPEWADIAEAPVCLPDTPLFSSGREDFFIKAAFQYGEDEIHGITCVSVKGSGYRALSHRDYLGSVLALGIERSFVGDIVTDGDYAARVFVFSKIAPLISSELDRVGSDKVAVTEEPLPPGFTAERRMEEFSAVTASMRLDAFVGSVFNLSRSDAKELVLHGLCEVNFETADRPDRSVGEGDVISARGYGKFIVGDISGTTRSEKTRVTVRKYI
ncbi:MAG: hypothetical protein IKI03_03375 [Clostridia bacterium]|nr:hypothetical protein [Clostridia bacterium]